jgi:hypothetical protein
MALALAFSPAVAAQPTIFDFVVGRPYSQRAIVCETFSGLRALVGMLNASVRTGSMPPGCNHREIEFIPRSVATGTAVAMPIRRRRPDGNLEDHLIPGQFMVATELGGQRGDVFIFYPTERMRLVQPGDR